MNYLIAAIVAGLLIRGLFLYYRVVRHTFWQETKNLDGEDLGPDEDSGREVPSGVLIWMNLADFSQSSKFH